MHSLYDEAPSEPNAQGLLNPPLSTRGVPTPSDPSLSDPSLSESSLSDPSLSDPVPPLVREVIAFFQGELAGQRFGDLDGDALASLAERTRAHAREVERARAALEEARATLDEARDELTCRAQQALAYARVFASQDEALAARLAALEAPEPPQERRRATRRRPGPPPRRAPETAAQLPFEARAGAA